MTRFARAKGSKSSNERLPDESTPWHVMKQQLESSLNKEKVTETKTKSAKQLLKEKDDLYYPTSLGNTCNDWAEFETPKPKTNTVKSGKIEKKQKVEKVEVKKAVEKFVTEENSVYDTNTEKRDFEKPLKNDKIEKKQNEEKVQVKKAAEKFVTEENTVNDTNTEKKDFEKPLKNKKRKLEAKEHNQQNDDGPAEPSQINHKKQKKKEKNKLKNVNEESNMNEQKESSENVSENKTEDNTESRDKLSKRQKRNQKKQNLKHSNTESKSVNTSTFNVEGNDWDNSVNFNKRRKFDDNQDEQAMDNNRFTNNSRFRTPNHNYDKNFRRFGDNVPRKYQKKTAKIRDDRDHPRRKPDFGPMKVTINGMDVEIVKYDGYPIKKEDAERLDELRKQMVMKAIPKSEIDKAMKLERRKCEKALARIKKQVCFHCRKAGHNLSDCPELGKEEAGTGICFKCGSTEHTHFECKVTKSDDYRYAKCFICREQGHIAKQCPDNPKGLYPDGGACKICGDVTHLKKDCPDLVKEKEETTITLKTINDDNLESLDNETVKVKTETKTKKIVKF